MTYYRRYRRQRTKPTPRNIEVRFAGNCACCGKRIEAGEIATYYPAGTIAGVDMGRLAHIGGLDGNSVVCFNELKRKLAAGVEQNTSDLDTRYEDECKERCGL
jgi:hypothetical protein